MITKTYKDSEILISLQCQGPWSWTAAVEDGEFEALGLVVCKTSLTPAIALRLLADEFEHRAQKEIFYHRVGVQDD